MSERMVELKINGRTKQLDAATLVEVVDALGLTGRPIVAEVNGAVIASEQWAITEMKTGMQIELVHFVGGG